MKRNQRKSLRFIDLFAGLGGFHLALNELGHECVFACELDEGLRNLYAENFGIRPEGDIRSIKTGDVPDHDILCAGFPCQPFSKAGSQAGRDCPKWGDLFDHVLRILRKRKPEFVFLENVPNLEKHKKGETWLAMKEQLERLGYVVDYRKLSPHQFGIPQVRERIFIVGSRTGLDQFVWPSSDNAPHPSILGLIDDKPADARPLSKQVENCLRVWQEFIQSFPKGESLPSFPIWTMEFGATYPYEEMTPFAAGERRLRNYRGSFGTRLSQQKPSDRMASLPSYARTEDLLFPRWKVQFIRQNREFYKRHRKWIRNWLPKIREFPSSLQKLEWNCKGEERDIWKYVIQFRASGVRVKRPTTSPSLIAMTSTQVPIIAWQRRYLTPRECARLQSMQGLPKLPESADRAFKALGNAVNVDLVRIVASSLLHPLGQVDTNSSTLADVRSSKGTAKQIALAGGGID